jgi:UDP-N-acetylglucosamine/UDP-N-acetylgalactosamine diphosphorylase
MLEKRLRDIGQDHIAKLLETHVDFLSPQMVLEDFNQVDFSLVKNLIEGKLIYEEPMKNVVEPAEVIPASYAATREAEKYHSHGEDLLRQGKVAALIVAGGQGSRLGIEAPKGVVGVTPLKSKSLFCLFSQKVLALCRRYYSTIPVYIMTSRSNNAHTKAFFEENKYFGLRPDEVYFFVQGMLPSVTPEGKFIISRSGGLFMNPDGHGGTFSALRKSGCLDIMREKGIEEIFYFQVDNPLVKVCDPLFIGLHNLGGAQMSSKVVRKRSFEEKVGVIARVDGKTRVIEYSDMSDEMRYATNEMEEMLHWAGSIAIHVIRREFVENLTRSGLRLPYHRAVKLIPTLDETGNPAEKKGVKFETFIFDALPLADKSITLEVFREEEFAPVKNKTGEDSLESSMLIQSTLHKTWLENIGVQVKDEVKVEISPLYALDEEYLRVHTSEIPDIIKSDIYLRGLGEEE